MINKEELKKIEDVMKSRGYKEWSHTEEGNGNIKTLFFLSLVNDGFNDNPPVTIFLDNEGRHTFQFSSVISPGALHLETGKCSPIWDDAHFENMKKHISKVINVLKENGYDA